ncbi:FAD-dependent oxidoreductase [Pseudonocardia sp. GCM10023141]|uniref:FAD-dependent oxidoreductase n=1 Tax=Pseudonocardia sp. GCM10023141 TaxID=3252653 RepID=UPI00361C9A1E
MTTALVIGGGVAGPVAAMALRRAGIEAAVYEAHPGPADDIGSFLTLQINGIDALRAVDAYDAVAGAGFATPSMRLRSGSGKLLGEVGTGAPRPDGTVSVTLRRSDLYAGLRDEAARRGVRVETGRRLVDATTAAAGVRVTFADGSTAEADILIGADGLHSRVRTLIDPGAAPARYLPVLNVGGYAPPQPDVTGSGGYEMVFGKRAFFGYAVAPSGEIWWFANPSRRDEPDPGELAAMTTAQWRSWLAELYADDRSPAAALVASTPGELVGRATYDMPPVRHWHRDRMVIIGDAAHATSPSSGQGASLAIEDAVQLARCLRDVPGTAAAFAAYESLRRTRVEKVVAAGRRTSNAKAAGPIGRALRDAVLPLVLRRVGSGPGWVHEHHIDWDAPVVPSRSSPETGHVTQR